MQAREQMQAGSWTAPEQLSETAEVLYLRYQAYRRRQAAKLLHVMPRDAVRVLYGRAREWARERGLHDGRDPMATLQKFALEILPLPPFEVWLEDRRRHPVSHLEDCSDDPHSPPVGRPGCVAQREFEHVTRAWCASLYAFREGEAWRGFLEFQERDGGPGYKTANIFRESSASQVRERFADFDDGTLTAFLLSVLP